MKYSPLSIEKQLFTIQVVWTIFMGTSLILLFFAYASSTNASWDFSLLMKYPAFKNFMLVSLIMVILQLIIPNIPLRQAVKRQKHPIDRHNFIQPFFLFIVVRVAMIETISIFGYLLATTMKNFIAMLPFAGVTLFLMLLNFPSQSYLEAKMYRFK